MLKEDKLINLIGYYKKGRKYNLVRQCFSPSHQHCPQAVSNSQAGSQLANNNRQAVNASQAGRQVIGSSNPEAVSTNCHGASAISPGR